MTGFGVICDCCSDCPCDGFWELSNNASSIEFDAVVAGMTGAWSFLNGAHTFTYHSGEGTITVQWTSTTCSHMVIQITFFGESCLWRMLWAGRSSTCGVDPNGVSQTDFLSCEDDDYTAFVPSVWQCKGAGLPNSDNQGTLTISSISIT